MRTFKEARTYLLAGFEEAGWKVVVQDQNGRWLKTQHVTSPEDHELRIDFGKQSAHLHSCGHSIWSDVREATVAELAQAAFRHMEFERSR